VINEIFEWTVGGASNRTASKFFRLVQNKIEISYTELETNKILTSSCERILESCFVLLFREAIYTRENPRGIGRVRVASKGDVVFARNETFKFNPTLQARTRPPQVPIGAI
jgi:hypothetical protein